MRRIKPYLIPAMGFVLVAAGFLLPFLMVLQVIEPTFALTFAAHFSSLTGLLLAVCGIFQRASKPPAAVVRSPRRSTA